MPMISSPAWIPYLNLCTKHHLRLLCAECLAAKDSEIKVELTHDDFDFLVVRKRSLKDLFPPGWRDWMVGRMLN